MTALTPSEAEQFSPDAFDSGGSFIVRTSGTTGTPKQVLLSAKALRASAIASHDCLGGGGQWLAALSPAVVAGLQVQVRSHLAGHQPLLLPASACPAEFALAIAEMTATRKYAAVVPLQLQRLVEAATQNADILAGLRSLDAILVGGQRLGPSALAQSTELGLHVVRSYGATETGGGCVYDGIGIGDTEVRVEAGEVWISGLCLADGYLDDDALTAERFTTDDSGRWFHTRDAGEIVDARLRVTGRLDRVFNSGAVKVSLDEIETVLTELPGWSSALAVAVDDPSWGERAALVQIEAEQHLAHALSFEQVSDILRARLGVAATPTKTVAVTQFALLASGKPDFAALKKLF